MEGLHRACSQEAEEVLREMHWWSRSVAERIDTKQDGLLVSARVLHGLHARFFPPVQLSGLFSMHSICGWRRSLLGLGVFSRDELG